MIDQISVELQTLMAQIDSQLSELRREASVIKRYDRPLALQIEGFANEIVETYANNLKIAISQPTEGVRTLTSVLGLTKNNRSRYLQQFLQSAIPTLRRKLMSPLWFGDHSTGLDQLDELERLIDSSKSTSLPLDEDLNNLNLSLQTFEEIVRKLEQDRQVSRMKTPIRTFLWGLPIWIGVAFSERIGVFGNIICFLILAGITLFSFILANRRALANINAQEPKTQDSLEFAKSFRQATIAVCLVFFVSLLLTFVANPEMRREAASLTTGDPIVVRIDNVIEGKPGDVVRPNLTIGTQGGVVFRIRAVIESQLLKDPQPVEISAINTPNQVVPLVVTIPRDAPAGDYPARLKLNYDIESASFMHSGYITKDRTVELRLIVKLQ